MSEFTRHFKEWTSQLMPSMSASKKQARTERRRSDRFENENDHHRHGAEGNAFHVNGEPEADDGKDAETRHGAEGNAFQVNGEPEADDGKDADDAP